AFTPFICDPTHSYGSSCPALCRASTSLSTCRDSPAMMIFGLRFLARRGSADAVGSGFAEGGAVVGEAAQQGGGGAAFTLTLMPGGDLGVDLAHAERGAAEPQPAGI